MGEVRTVVELREIFSCLELIPNIGVKALMTFILSSGMDRDFALTLTIKNLVNACRHELQLTSEDEVNQDSLDKLLEMNPNRIVARWVNETDDKLRINFSSPESLFYIFLYLKNRMLEGNLDLNDKLFDIPESTIDDNLRVSEKLTTMGSFAPSPKDGETISHKFTLKDLQEFFETQCLNHLPEDNLFY